MASTLTKLFPTGILQTAVELDEVTYSNIKISPTGVYAAEFDEVNLTAGTAERRTSAGVYMVSGYFDEYTLVQPLGIVTTGLRLHLDAGDPLSYPGSGTVWTDLASGLKGSMGAGVSYSSTNNGVMVFNGGSTAVVSVTTASTVTSLTNNITIEGWYKSTNNHPEILSTGIGSNGVCLGYFSTGGTNWKVTKYGVVDIYTGSIPQNTAWHQVVVTYSSTAGTKVYVDGALSNASANTANIAASNVPTVNIGTLESTYHNGSIGIIRWYNTVLSATDVLQNFNANRGRYGI